MTETGTSLRPYGQALSINRRLGLHFGDPQRDPALARAKAKLGTACADPPLGPPVLANVIRLGMAISLASGGLAATMVWEKAQAAIYPGVLCALVLTLYSLYALVAGRPKTPVHAAREWLRCIQNHEWGRAHRLVVAADRDPWLRCPPSLAEANLGPERAEVFGDLRGFRKYWLRTLIQGVRTRLRLRAARDLAPMKLSDDLWAVPLELRIEPAVYAGKLPWQPFAKLVVRCGNEWRMFSGELSAPEEANLSWVQTPEDAPQSHSEDASAA